MSHEIFVIERNESLNTEQQHRVEYLREKMDAAKEVGLTSEAARINQEIVAIERGSLIKTAPLTADEIAIWQEWLPTIYGDKPSSRADRQLGHYVFDRVPAPVLMKWKAHKAAGDFEAYEIWTPERTPVSIDPILVGLNGTVRHLIARWGESDANLVTFDDIKQLVKKRIRSDLTAEVSMTAVFVAMILLFPTAIIAAATGITWAILGYVAVVAVMFVGTFLYQRSTYKKMPAILAIARHHTIDRDMLPAEA